MKKRPVWVDYTMIIVGAFIMGFAIKNMYDPVNLVTGGVSGVAIIMKELARVPLWVTNTVLNIPLFLAAWKIKGWGFIKRTAVATVALSVSLYVIPEAHILTDDIFLAALFGGIISGIGTGLVFMFSATTGGTDMLAALIQRKLRQYSIAQIMQVIDAAIVIVGMYVFGVERALYAIIAVYLVTKVSDGLIEGLKFSKVAYIITDEYDLVAKEIFKELERGVTAIKAKGMYSGNDKCMLYCVVARKEIVTLKEIVAEIDPSAFVIVTDAREVLGEGFQEHGKTTL